VYVGAESADLIHRIRFGPAGAVVEKTIPVGESPVEMEGPHGLQISPDGKFLHMTTGHGSPDGKYWKYELGPDTLVGPGLFLGYFPASIDVTPDGLYAFVVNFNLHGEMVPSSVSVVYTPNNEEVARTETCTMPHGSRIDASGSFQYSTCMMDDQLVEIDTRSFAVSRRFSVAKGRADAKHLAAGHKVPMPPSSCSPTWAQPSADGGRIYVACNKADEIIEIARTDWKVTRRFATGRGPYNLAATPDARLRPRDGAERDAGEEQHHRDPRRRHQPGLPLRVRQQRSRRRPAGKSGRLRPRGAQARCLGGRRSAGGRYRLLEDVSVGVP
jgi:DNA-binding beta-propeller fold protein YncE